MKFKVLVILFLNFFIYYNALAVKFATSLHHPDGFKFATYLNNFSADKLNDKNGNTLSDNMGLSYTSIYLRPVYYKGDFVSYLTVPIEYRVIDSTDFSESGLGDILIGLGYFLPVEYADIGFLTSVKLPTGDKNKGLGTGQTDLIAELYYNKFIKKFAIDGALKYSFRFKDGDYDPGDKLAIEGLGSYMITRKTWAGAGFIYSYTDNAKLNENTINKTYSSKFSINGMVNYKLQKNLSLNLEIVQDIDVRNYFEGTLFSSKLSYSFK